MTATGDVVRSCLQGVWLEDSSAYGGPRERIFLPQIDCAFSYASGRWDVQRNGQACAHGEEATLEEAKARVMLVHAAFTKPLA